MWTRFIVMIIQLQLDLGIRGFKITSRTNLESGPWFTEVWPGGLVKGMEQLCKIKNKIDLSGMMYCMQECFEHVANEMVYDCTADLLGTWSSQPCIRKMGEPGESPPSSFLVNKPSHRWLYVLFKTKKHCFQLM